jgi:hypothetical protein
MRRTSFDARARQGMPVFGLRSPLVKALSLFGALSLLTAAALPVQAEPRDIDRHQRLERGAEWADGAAVTIDRRTALACAALAVRAADTPAENPAWQNGDEATLINLLREEMAPPKLQAWLEQTLLAERNRNWVKKWPSLPNESFIVVGALHLYGEHGLLALLEQQGWRITPLTEPTLEKAK